MAAPSGEPPGQGRPGINPDGKQLAYVVKRAQPGPAAQIYLRSLDRLEARPIPGTEGGRVPFFSPDGRWLGFFGFRQRKLLKVPLSGGPPIALCDAMEARGASWGPDGTIVFTRDTASGLDRVSAEGGAPEALTTLDPTRDESSHRLPEVLPGGQAVVFTVKTHDLLSFDDARIEVVSLKTRKRSVLVTGGTNARYAGGHLIYERGGSLLAAPFDPTRLEVTGPSVPVLEGVSSSGENGFADFGVSRDGSLVYVPGKNWPAAMRLVRVDRTGRSRPLMDARRIFYGLRLSPDGRRLALMIEGVNNQVWVFDLERSTFTPQTLRRGNNGGAIWTPDGKRLTFTSDRDGPWNLFWQPADGSGPAERLAPWTSQYLLGPEAWSPDGKTLVFSESRPTTSLDIWVFRLGERQPQPLLQESFNESSPALSPNGRWLAYTSQETGPGPGEVYVRSFPGSEGRWPISTDGGNRPVWARNGRELYYRIGNRMMAVTVTSDATFSATKPRVLFETRAYLGLGLSSWSYDVTPEGEFLMIEPDEADVPPSQINVVLNWMQEVRQRVAAR